MNVACEGSRKGEGHLQRWRSEARNTNEGRRTERRKKEGKEEKVVRRTNETQE